MSFFDDQEGGGGPAAAVLKLSHIGAAFQGVIEHIGKGYKSKYNANPNAQRENELDAEGKPIPELRIVVAGTPDNYATATKPLVSKETGQPLPDDGRRLIYIAKGTNISFRTHDALKEVSGGGPLRDLEVGGRYAVRYAEDIPTQNGNPARGHQVAYQLPPANAGGFFGGQGQPTQAQQQVQQPQFQQQAPPAQQQFAPPVQQPAQQYAPPAQQGWGPPAQQAAPAAQAPAPQQQFQGQPGPQMLAGQPNPMADPNAPGQQFQQPAAPAADPWVQPQGQPPAGQQNWAPGQVSDNPPF